MYDLQSLQNIKQELLENLHDDLRANSNNLVFGKGNEKADILFIGEAPGAKEDEIGEPFVGAAGRELDKLLTSINLSLSDVYITNILKYRPPNNKDPTKEEIKRHTPYLIKQIHSIKPKVICTLGNYATKFILGEFKVANMKNIKGISTLHGKAHKIVLESKELLVVPLYHPAAMLYNPPLRKTLEEDFKLIKKLI